MKRVFLTLAMALVWQTPGWAQLRIVATLPDLGAIAREVVGTDADVVVLASPDQDPHYVDPRPSFLVALSRADLLIANGMELEIGWLPTLVVNARNPKIQVGAAGYLDTSAHVAKLEIPQQVDRVMGDVHASGNPHFLLDPRRAIGIVGAIAERCAQLDPPHATQYRERGRVYSATLQSFGEAQTRRFAALDASRRTIVTYHRSVAYLADWLGLSVVAEVESKPGVAPDPRHVANVLQMMRAQSIRVVVQEAYYPATTTRQLATLAKAQMITLAGGARVGQSYLDRISAYVEPLYTALHK